MTPTTIIKESMRVRISKSNIFNIEPCSQRIINSLKRMLRFEKGGTHMYCPLCKTEYREGFSKCADCKVPLVENLPPEEPESVTDYVDLQEVMTSFDIGEISMARSRLDDHNISYFVEGENFSTCFGSMPARILVPRDKMKKAKEILKDFL